MLADLDGCVRSPSCRAQVEANAARLRRAGNVKILAYDSKTAYTLGAAEGLTRVAWTVIDNGLPVVQCVDVRRGGNVLTGRTVTLRRLSAPIGRQSPCGRPQRPFGRRVPTSRMRPRSLAFAVPVAAAALGLAAGPAAAAQSVVPTPSAK